MSLTTYSFFFGKIADFVVFRLSTLLHFSLVSQPVFEPYANLLPNVPAFDASFGSEQLLHHATEAAR